MRRANRWAPDEEGSAALEFLGVGILLLVPLVYLVLALGVIQEHLLGVEAAARHAARVLAQASDPDTAVDRADIVLAGMIEQYGMDPDSVDVRLSCTPAGGECPAPGAVVQVTVTARVSLPFVPAVFGLDRATSIPLEATATQKSSRQRGAP